jgi:hypothetical protein
VPLPPRMSVQRCNTHPRSRTSRTSWPERDIRRVGHVGEERVTKLIYLAVTSRLLAKPVSCAMKGPSAAGKSAAVERVLSFFPGEAYYALTGMSERALAYSKEPLEHRMLVVYELAGMASDWASYLIRSLLSEGCVRYETVEKTSEGMEAKLIERDGPTGLICTTTAVSLHPENETRLLSLPVDDTSQQTKAVMQAIARENGHNLDLSEWHTLQHWLADGERRVVVPFAGYLSDNIPPLAVRLRRDFGAILGLIRAHALLHRAARDIEHDRVVATVDDYARVRELVADLVSEGISATVRPATRETVEMVEGWPATTASPSRLPGWRQCSRWTSPRSAVACAWRSPPATCATTRTRRASHRNWRPLTRCQRTSRSCRQPTRCGSVAPLQADRGG